MSTQEKMLKERRKEKKERQRRHLRETKDEVLDEMWRWLTGIILKLEADVCLGVSANGQCTRGSVFKSTNRSSVTMATGLLQTDI